MQLKRIFLPEPNPDNLYSNYDNQLGPKLSFDSPDAKEIFDRNQDAIFAIVEAEILAYVTDDDLCNDDEDMFPKRSVMSGEWYVQSVTSENEMVWIETALLEDTPEYRGDYLGLCVSLRYDRQSGEFTVCGVDSASI